MTTLSSVHGARIPIQYSRPWRPPWYLRVWVAFSRLWRWEFWPRTLFYAPLVPWLVWLAVRHRSLTVFTAANPGIPQGGVVGESKYDILRHLPTDAVVAAELVPPGPLAARMQAVEAAVLRGGWSWPIILKPDIGERGRGVRLVHDVDEARNALAEQPETLIAQAYHPGPFEAGIFYIRHPGESRGRIFSITNKRFPHVSGDGCSTVEQLIWADARLRMQAQRFSERLGPRLSTIPQHGECVRLATAGNHCQGTLFTDGSDLITPALERRFDAIARAFPGFYFGRFDVRYTHRALLMRGEQFAIVELNGVLSESTNIYDPRGTLWKAYRTLAQQWSSAFSIGAANAPNRARVLSLPGLVRMVRNHSLRQRERTLAD